MYIDKNCGFRNKCEMSLPLPNAVGRDLFDSMQLTSTCLGYTNQKDCQIHMNARIRNRVYEENNNIHLRKCKCTTQEQACNL